MNKKPLKITKIVDGPWKGEEEIDHEAFGQIRISRVHGLMKLYGSALGKHEESICISVHRSTQRHGLGQNWYHADSRSIVELYLSPAQFADMITGLNIGGGVPCTLTVVDGKLMSQIPWDHENEADKVVKGFEEEVAETVSKLNEHVEKFRALMSQKTLSAADRKAAVSALDKFNQLYKDNAPFMVEQFQRAASKTVTSAKAEIEAFSRRVVVETGVQALKAPQDEPKQLPSKEE